MYINSKKKYNLLLRSENIIVRITFARKKIITSREFESQCLYCLETTREQRRTKSLVKHE